MKNKILHILAGLLMVIEVIVWLVGLLVSGSALVILFSLVTGGGWSEGTPKSTQIMILVMFFVMAWDGMMGARGIRGMLSDKDDR